MTIDAAARAGHLSDDERRTMKAAAELRTARRTMARTVLLDLLRVSPDLTPWEIVAHVRRTNMPAESVRLAIYGAVRAGLVGARDVDGVRRYFLRRP